MKPYQTLIATIILSLFYSFGVTLLVHSMAPMIPTNQTNLLTQYQEEATDLNTIQSKINVNLGSQFNIPLVDLGALVFFSGNLVADLMMNFFFAVPSITRLIVRTLFLFIHLDPLVANVLENFIFMVVSIIYLLTIIAFILQVRSRGSLI